MDKRDVRSNTYNRWAIGNSGNVIYINNSNKFVCGITGYFKPTIFDRVAFIQKYLDK